MLRIIVQASARAARFQLCGKLAGLWVSELEQCWQRAKAVLQSKSFVIDLTAVTFIDAAGKALLASLHEQGAKLLAAGPLNKAIVEEITRLRKPAATGSNQPKPAATGSNRPKPAATGTNRPKGAATGANRPRRAATSPGPHLLVLLMILFLLAAAGSLRAQDKPVLRLTLRQAVQLALRQNPQVQIANLNVAQSGQDKDLARSALLPQAGLHATERVVRTNLAASFGRTFPGLPEHIGPFQAIQAGPQFSMPVFDLTLWRRLQQGRQGIRASQAQELSVREQNVLLVVSQYLGSLRATADVEAARSRVELAQALYDLAADLQKNGVGTGIDTLRSNVLLQQEKQRLIAAESQKQTSLYGLVQLLNLDPRQTIELADEISFFETPEFPADQSIEQALVNRPEMKALASRERIAQLERSAASESRLPTVRAVASWSQLGTKPDAVIPAYEYALSLDVPLFTGGRIRAETTKADLELKKIEQDRQNLRNQIAFQVKTALVQLGSARSEVDVANLTVKLAREEVDQARDRFRAGVANNIEIITAQDELSRANDNQIAALYRYNQARADLAHAIGQMETLYAK